MDSKVMKLAIGVFAALIAVILIIVYASNADKINSFLKGSAIDSSDGSMAELSAASNGQIGNNLQGFMAQKDFFDDPDYLASIKPWGRSAVHLAWGEQMHNRLVYQWGVKERNVPVTGHVTLDYLRKPLSNFFLGRDELFEKYRIPKDKRVHLFISSLVLVASLDFQLALFFHSFSLFVQLLKEDY